MPDPQDIPLTALCAICHVNSIKYTCPRCSIHTCSLSCVKCHKQYAQCSGVRDPAAYRKRSELATPSSIDQDFNFITKVERSLKRADDEVTERGIHLAPAGLKRYGGPQKTKFESEVEMRGIKLIRAPQGLSRRKQNKSSWKGNALMWTVEWLPFNGDVRWQNVAESKTVGESFFAHYGRKGLSRKRKREPDESVSRQTRKQDDGEDIAKQEEVVLKMEAAAEIALSSAPEAEEAPQPAAERRQPLQDLHFYLHRPQTSSKLKCLIPIDSKATWKEILNGRTLLEFPTVYVREEPPEELTGPFILEQDYSQKHGEDLVVHTHPVLESTDDSTSSPSTLDSNKILEVLKQDLSN
jgi:HIT zinc finger